MTSTEQDKELREAIINIVEAEYKKPNCIPAVERVEYIMQLITADRRRVALEARIDELEHTFVSYDNALASELVENPEWEYGQVVERIAELKQELEKL